MQNILQIITGRSSLGILETFSKSGVKSTVSSDLILH